MAELQCFEAVGHTADIVAVVFDRIQRRPAPHRIASEFKSNDEPFCSFKIFMSF